MTRLRRVPSACPPTIRFSGQSDTTVVDQRPPDRGHTPIKRKPPRRQTGAAFTCLLTRTAYISEDVDVLIHAAWVLSGNDTSELWRQNVVGSRQLIEAARAAGVEKIVFISSMSAYFGTRQSYGQMKPVVERTALDWGCVVIRPGLVYGASSGGMAGTLQKISGLPLWPRFRTAKLFLAYEEDVAAAMAAVIEIYDEMSGEILGFAHPESLDLSSILTGLAPQHKRRPSVPLPALLVMGVLRVLERANVQFPFRSDSLLRLVEGAAILPGQQLLTQRGVKFRALDA